MVPHGFRKRAEDDSQLRQLFLERGGDGNAVEDGIDRYAREQLLLFEWNAELLKGTADFRIDFIEAGERLLLLRRRVVNDVLVVDGAVLDVAPARLSHRRPDAVSLETPFQQPLRLLFLRRDYPDDVLAQTPGNRLLLDVGEEAVLVLAARKLFDCFGGRTHLTPDLFALLDAERHTAATCAGGVRVIQEKTLAQQTGVVVQGGAVEYPKA